MGRRKTVREELVEELFRALFEEAVVRHSTELLADERIKAAYLGANV